MTKPFKCKLGLHSYVPVQHTAKTSYDILKKALLDVIPDSNSSAYKYVFTEMYDKAKAYEKINLRNKIIRDDVCLECGKIKYKVNEEYNKAHKTASKLLKMFEGMMKIKKSADKLYMEGCACKKNCNFIKDNERV